MNQILKKPPFLVGFLLISVLILSSNTLAGRPEGGQIDNFDIQPRTARAGDTVNVTLQVTLFRSEIRAYCGQTASTLYYEVFERTKSNLKNHLKAPTGVAFDQFMDGVSEDLPFSATLSPVPAGSPSRQFYAAIYCYSYLGLDRRDIAESNPIALSATSGVCNNNGVCDPGETSSACPLDKCPTTPGTPQTIIFNITNPLQANDLLQLIDTIATWLFNIAIPITVAMIVYSGVVFLISRGDTGKITQARKILLYAVVGFTIILIGKGFITLIESILNLGVPMP